MDHPIIVETETERELFIDLYYSNGINWWKTPPESPDFNPIENLWHELKEFIRREVKPKQKLNS